MVLMIYYVMEIVHWLMLLPQEMEILVIKSITQFIAVIISLIYHQERMNLELLMKMDV